VGYYGVGEVELKKDPRDDVYKLIEVNARTTSQNRLAAECGVDAEYIAYLDANEYHIKAPIFQCDNIVWVDDFTDFVSCLIDLKRRNTTIAEVFRLLMVKKVHSIVDWDDPAPVVARIVNLVSRAFNLLLNSLSRNLRQSRG
jgi:predicted ATP-grasp superfamily ATP-dependent carboligase